MKLIIKTGGEETEFFGISLEDGCIPAVAFKEGQFDVSKFPLEPARWFKVLLIETMKIDCDDQVIRYRSYQRYTSCESLDLSGRFMASMDSYAGTNNVVGAWREISDEELYNHGDISVCHVGFEQVFLRAKSAVMSKTKPELYEEVMNILHNHILPITKLVTEDQLSLGRVLDRYEEHLHNIGHQRTRLEREMKRIKNAMFQERHTIVNNVMRGKITKDMLPTSTFLAVLDRDLHGDSETFRGKLNMIEEELKKIEKNFIKITKDCPPDFLPPEAEKLLREQTRLLEKKERVTEWYINTTDCMCILEILSEPSHAKMSCLQTACQHPDQVKKLFDAVMRKKSKHTYVAQQKEITRQVYMDMAGKYAKYEESKKELYHKQVLVVSITESMRATLDQLEKDQESYGIINSYDSSSGQKVESHSKWKTLAELISELLTDTKSDVFKAHQKGCDYLIDMCHKGLRERNLQLFMTMECKRRSDSELEAETILQEPDDDMTAFRQRQTRPSELNQLSISDDKLGNTSHLFLPSPAEVSEFDSFLSSCSRSIIEPYDEVQLVEFQAVQTTDYNILHNPKGDYVRNFTSKLKKETKEHFFKMCQLIQTKMQYHTKMAFQNIQVSYTPHFFQVTMPWFDRVYRAAFNNIRESLQKVPTLKITDLDFQSSYAVDMLQDDPDAKIKLDKVEGATAAPPSNDEPVVGVYSDDYLDEEHSAEEDVNLPSLEYLNEEDPITDDEDLMFIKVGSQPNYVKPDLQIEFHRHKGKAMPCHVKTVHVPRPQKLMALKPEYCVLFQNVFELMANVISCPTPLMKLQHMAQCVREVTEKIENYRQDVLCSCAPVTTDDIVEILVILLCNCEVNVSSTLFAHTMLIDDFKFLHKFLQHGLVDYSFIQFVAAFEFIINKLKTSEYSASV